MEMAYVQMFQSMHDDAFARIKFLEGEMDNVVERINFLEGEIDNLVERNNFLESELDNVINNYNDLVGLHNKLNELVNKIISNFKLHSEGFDAVVELYDNKFLCINKDIDNIVEFINNSDY